MNKKIKITLIVLVIFVAGINTIVIFHAYKFTHFDNSIKRTESPENLSILSKITTLLFGVSNPKPKATSYPLKRYSEIKLKHHFNLSLWKIDVEQCKGTVILFHGFASEKSSLIPYSNVFNELGYKTVLVDFRGCGESKGNTTTIGYYESEDVLEVYKHVKNKLKEDNIILFGSSMGAAAIIKSINDFNITPNKIILLNPFQNLQIAISNRFKMMGLNPYFFSDMLLFWGGVINDFDGFEFENDVYAKNIKSDVLLFYGKYDERVNFSEVKNIYDNINSNKFLKYYHNSGHGDYLENEYDRFYNDLEEFLQN